MKPKTKVRTAKNKEDSVRREEKDGPLLMLKRPIMRGPEANNIRDPKTPLAKKFSILESESSKSLPLNLSKSTGLVRIKIMARDNH
jgi:hypothetical protein